MTCVVTHLQDELRIWTIKDEPKEWECKGSTRKYNRAPGSTTVLRESRSRPARGVVTPGRGSGGNCPEFVPPTGLRDVRFEGCWGSFMLSCV